MTGWRIGYIISTNLEVKQWSKSNITSQRSNDAMQYAVLEAMEKANDYPSVMAAEFQSDATSLWTAERHARVQCHCLKGLFTLPKVDVPGMSSEEIAMELLRDGVLCSPGVRLAPLAKVIYDLHTPSARGHRSRHGQG